MTIAAYPLTVKPGVAWLRLGVGATPTATCATGWVRLQRVDGVRPTSRCQSHRGRRGLTVGGAQL